MSETIIYRLVQSSPPEIVTDKAVEKKGFRLRRDFSGDASEMRAPDGMRYLPVVEQDRPTPGENEKLSRLPDAIIGDEVHTNRWEVVDMTTEEIAAASRKTWPDAAAFLAEFSIEQLAAISLSTNPTVAALRLLLASWPADVWSDDPRIILGLGELVSDGIITAQEANEKFQFPMPE